MSELVSIIVPVFNTQDFLKECIDSLLNQTYRNIEIILIDDNSSDSSPEICREYAELDARVRFFKRNIREAGGVSNIRNKGLASASGEWVMFCDSDDVYSHDAVENILKFAHEHNNVEIVFASFYYWEDKREDKSLEIYKPDLADGVYTAEYISEHYSQEIQFSSLSCIGSKIYRKSLIDDNNIRFDTDYKSFGEDIAFMISCLDEAGRAGYIDFPFYRYRMRASGSLSHLYRPSYFADAVKVGKIMLSFMHNTSKGRKIYYAEYRQYNSPL